MWQIPVTTASRNLIVMETLLLRGGVQGKVTVNSGIQPMFLLDLMEVYMWQNYGVIESKNLIEMGILLTVGIIRAVATVSSMSPLAWQSVLIILYTWQHHITAGFRDLTVAETLSLSR